MSLNVDWKFLKFKSKDNKWRMRVKQMDLEIKDNVVVSFMKFRRRSSFQYSNEFYFHPPLYPIICIIKA